MSHVDKRRVGAVESETTPTGVSGAGSGARTHHFCPAVLPGPGSDSESKEQELSLSLDRAPLWKT
jgi:hypothetical protein